MQNIEEQEEVNSHPQLIITEEIRSYIYDVAKWANFLAVVGFVIAAFMLLAALTIGTAMNTNPQVAAMMGTLGNVGSTAITIVFIAYGLAIFYPSLLLSRYARKTKIGVLYGEQESLNESFSALKSLFKYWGIIVIILIGLNLLSVFTKAFGV
jgi:hypothetical protein